MLRWDFNKKMGEVTVTRKGEEYVLPFYEGNAYMIITGEWEENGEKMYNLQGFFADKDHAKKCLGLSKNRDGELDNLYKDEWVKIRINKKYRHCNELAGMLVKAFDNIAIEIYTEVE